MKKNENRELSELHTPGAGTNPFGREHSLSMYRTLRLGLHKVFAEEFRHGVGGVNHLWVFHAILTRENVSWVQFIFMSYAVWLYRHDQHVFTSQNFAHAGWSYCRIRELIFLNVDHGYIERFKRGKFRVTYKGFRFYEGMVRMMFNGVADVYATLDETKNPGKLPGLSTQHSC